MESEHPKILFLEPFGQHEGHPPIESKRVTEALTDAGVRITMVTFDGVREQWVEASKIEWHITVISQFWRWRPIAQVLRLMPGLRRYLPARYIVDLLETALTVLIAIRASRRQRYDAIHFYDGQPALFFPFASALLTKNQNFVVNIYFPSPEQELKSGHKGFKDSLKSKDYRYAMHLLLIRLINTRVIALLQRFFYQMGLKRNRFSFFCHTRELKESYKTYLGGMIYQRLHVIPLGVKPPEASPLSQSEVRQYLHLPQQAKLLLWFGTNHFSKNMEVIFQAVQDMPETFHLLFVGKLAEGDKVRDPSLLAQRYGWEENTIVVRQFVPEAEKPYYFYASDAIILSHIKEFIVSASVLNEACQFSLPAICSDVGQPGEWVKKYCLGTTFLPEEPESLRQAVNSFLNLTEEERLAIKANFYRFAADLPWHEVAKRYKALYLRQMPTPFPDPEASKA